MAWVGKDLKDYEVSTPLPQAGLHLKGYWFNGMECRIISKCLFVFFNIKMEVPVLELTLPTAAQQKYFMFNNLKGWWFADRRW